MLLREQIMSLILNKKSAVAHSIKERSYTFYISKRNNFLYVDMAFVSHRLKYAYSLKPGDSRSSSLTFCQALSWLSVPKAG